jgi:hypothetical protein
MSSLLSDPGQSLLELLSNCRLQEGYQDGLAEKRLPIAGSAVQTTDGVQSLDRRRGKGKKIR